MKRFFAGLTAGGMLAITISAASAATIHETAIIGTTGLSSGSAISSGSYLGSQFELSQTTKITGIGGHMFAAHGNMFGAIVSLDPGLMKPSFLPSELEANTLAHTVFNAGLPSADYIAPISVVLGPGNYAVIFGSGLFGSSGLGGMPGNNTPIAGTSFFASGGFGVIDGTHVWHDAQTDPNLRFVVEGVSRVPLPPALSLFASALIGGGVIAWRRRRKQKAEPLAA